MNKPTIATETPQEAIARMRREYVPSPSKSVGIYCPALSPTFTRLLNCYYNQITGKPFIVTPDTKYLTEIVFPSGDGGRGYSQALFMARLAIQYSDEPGAWGEYRAAF